MDSMAPKKNAPKKPMTDAHKAALAEGRAQGRAVRNYLEGLEANRPKRGRKRTPQSIKKRLDTINEQIDEVSPLKRVQLIQERMNLEAELASGDRSANLQELEAEFVANAKSYAERKNISYQAWRELGVPASVLSSAGISRSS